LAGTIGSYLALRSGLPTPETIASFKAPASTRILDCKGRVISELFMEKRRPVPLETIPAALREVVIAVEDKRFYSHWGIDLIRVAGSALQNIIHPGNLQGASTITQQLARSMFLTPARRLSRKLREMVLALELERHYSKQEILEMYLNQVWFGGSVYGVGAAAERYFGKHVSRLDPIECATLAAMLANPGVYSPYTHPDRLLKRRNFFLGKLRRLGRITEAEFQTAIKQPLNVLPGKGPRNEAPYFVEEIRRYLMDRYGSDFVYKSGATIYTTLDLDIQAAANKALNEKLNQIEKDYALKPTKAWFDSVAAHDSTIGAPTYLQGALVALDVPTGAVRALVGGRDYRQSEFDRATQALRQAGSAFKPFLYTAAIDNGLTPADIEADSAITITIPGQPSYRPHNFDNKFLGPITLRRALALSRNLVSVRLIAKLGPELMARYAHLMGITGHLPPYYSLALGSVEVTLLDMTSAFNTLANGGIRTRPLMVLRVEDEHGLTLEQNRPDLQPVLSPATAYILTNMLQSVVNEGTATAIRALGYTGPAAGKTGTTDDYTDAWFIGYTPTLCCGIWVGYDQKRTIFRGATGGGVAAPIWAEFMKQVTPDTLAHFPVPAEIQDTILTLPICEQSGKLATTNCPRVRYEVFIKGTEPRANCPLHAPDRQ